MVAVNTAATAAPTKAAIHVKGPCRNNANANPVRTELYPSKP